MSENYENTIQYFSNDISINYVHSTIFEHLKSHWKYNPSENLYCRILLVVKGEYTAYIDGAPIIIKENDMVYVPSNMSYTSKSNSPEFSYYSVFFEVPYDKLIRNKIFNSLQQLEGMGKYRSIFDEINQIYNQKSFGYKLKMMSLAYTILWNFLNEKMLQDNMFTDYYVIKEAINYINNNYQNKNISINHLAKICKITPTYFTFVFKKIYHVSPKKYITRLRIGKACDLLKHSTYSITDIADFLGYHDSAYFSAVFKSSKGLSPTQYRHICHLGTAKWMK